MNALSFFMGILMLLFVSVYSYGQTKPDLPVLPPIEMVDTIKRDSIFLIPIAKPENRLKYCFGGIDQMSFLDNPTQVKSISTKGMDKKSTEKSEPMLSFDKFSYPLPSDKQGIVPPLLPDNSSSKK